MYRRLPVRLARRTASGHDRHLVEAAENGAAVGGGGPEPAHRALVSDLTPSDIPEYWGSPGEHVTVGPSASYPH